MTPSTTCNGLNIYVAGSEPGKPVCIYGTDKGFGLTVFQNDSGKIVGVLVMDIDGNLLSATGWVPAEFFEQEYQTP